MTNKDTERLVRSTMQQTIPDKDALWSRIEARLPEQRTATPIRRTSGGRIARTIAAAACFLLVIGSIGTGAVLLGGRNHMETANTTQMCDEAPASAQKQCAEDAADGYEDAAGIADEAAEFAGEAAGISGNADKTGEAPAAEAEADGGGLSGSASQSIRKSDEQIADNASPSAAELVTLTGHIHGEPTVISADTSLLTQAAALLDDADAQLKEEITAEALGNARKTGVVLTFTLDGAEVTLLALDGTYRMIAADGRVYHAPETALQLLESLETS